MKKNIISRMRFVVVMTLALGAAFAAQAQMGTLLYGSNRIPQNNAFNPAFFPQNNKIYIALPALRANINMPLAYSDAIKYEAGDEYSTLDLNSISDAFSKSGGLGLNLDVHALGAGFRVKNMFFTLSSQAKVSGYLAMPNEILDFLQHGNADHVGENDKLHLINGQFFNVQAYTEYALGFGYEINKNITVGGHLKLYNGYLVAQPKDTKVDLFTAADYSQLRADMDYHVNFGGCLQFDDSNKVSGVTPVPNNWGFGLDLGASYECDLFDASISILDLTPGITWNQNVYQVSPVGGEVHVTFDGVDISGAANGDGFDTTQFQAIMDSLRTNINPNFTEGGSFKTSIPTKFNASANIHILPFLRAGLVFHGEYDKAMTQAPFRCSTSLLGHLNLADRFELVVGNTVVNNGFSTDWFNPGFGVDIATARPVQLYFFVDYLSSLYVVDMKSVNMYLGLNVMIGNRKAEKK